jgi:hypothetical protein
MITSILADIRRKDGVGAAGDHVVVRLDALGSVPPQPRLCVFCWVDPDPGERHDAFKKCAGESRAIGRSSLGDQCVD